ncbi:hypothetical protein CN378_12130 [Bacillus sp. AFS015802]|uniref:hypothetical protein n=1 Tax=Bacillus sp. AFS015802 TaxID=2033486 RepID=UPI000BF433D4|nr:hypothetical protein [Bacillus sp. AFS015802]PFA67117.1 hypothetical protein CN378_12130 [Bacillus sp. AFS015802]
MIGTINPIRLNEFIEYEDLFHEMFKGTSLKAGSIRQIVYWIEPEKSIITYDILIGNKKFMYIEDSPSPPSIQRCELTFRTLFELHQSVDIEIAGVKRPSVISSIKVVWGNDKYLVLYGLNDRTDTTYFGVQEELLIKWNPEYGRFNRDNGLYEKGTGG